MPYAREVRLGLVLYGGVSLAVYENGVARELYHAVRGDGIYGLIKELTDSDIVVDIVSGTSAGGINGVMLSYALVNNKDFTLVGDLWRDQADIDQLLRKERDNETQSVLNSGWYEERLKECFQLLEDSTPQSPHAPSSLEELDLFVTGTDAHGVISTVYDDAGHPIDVKNHRALFKLAYRAERPDGSSKNDFAKANAASLAKLCCLTSCFPVAFAPVLVGKADTQVYRWGHLQGPAVYLDGGILNNKPFTSTIDAIRRRTANRDVDRLLIYVEPDPEKFKKPDPNQTPTSPPPAQAALLGLVSIPDYQSIAGDLTAIEAHNERAERIRTILEKIPRARCVAPAHFTPAEVCPPCIDSTDPYFNCRLVQLRDKAVEGILNGSYGREFMPKDELIDKAKAGCNKRHAARVLVESFNYWAPHRDTLRNFDVYVRLRRTRHLADALMQISKNAQSSLRTGATTKIWDVVNHYFKLYEIVEWAMKDCLDRTEFNWKDYASSVPDVDMIFDEKQRQSILGPISAREWDRVSNILVRLLDTDGIAVPVSFDKAARAQFYKSLDNRRRDLPTSQPAGNLLLAIDDQFERFLACLPNEPVPDLLRGEYIRFPDLDRVVFPLQFGAEFEATEAIRIVRFSPQDAQRGWCLGEVSGKVCGRTLGAFGGFFKKGWRANDIMMGRMDAACQLVECILTRERLAKVRRSGSYTAHKIQSFFTNPIPNDKAHELANTLNQYLIHAEDATVEEWNALVNQFVAMAHAEIAEEEWPRVLKCSVEQEYLWGQYRTHDAPPNQPFDWKHLVWRRARRKPDRILVSLANEAIRQRRFTEFKPRQIAGHPFGDEIPEPILTELGLLGAIRTSESLMASIDKDWQDPLKKNFLYRRLFSQLLPLAYNWAAIRRHNPDSIIVLNTIIPTACITVFLLGILFAFDPFHWEIGWKIWTVMMGVPVLFFSGWLWIFSLRGRRHSLRRKRTPSNIAPSAVQSK